MSSIAEGALASSVFFSVLRPDTIRQLVAEVETVTVPGGEVLFHQGDVADCLYVVVSGRLRVSVEGSDGAEYTLGEAGRGDLMGEIAMLSGEPRSATVRAVRDTDLVRLGQDAFNHLVSQHPKLMMQITRLMIDRYHAALRAPGRGGQGRLSTVALIPTSGDVRLPQFAERLERALGSSGTVLRLDSATMDRELGPGSARIPADHSRNSEVAAWLMQQESAHDTVLYEADSGRSAWTNRCIRQADRILLVGDADSGATLGPIELAMQRDGTDNTAVGKELVLLHREKRRVYSGTREWLSSRRVDRHHHVVIDSDADFGRLVRILTRRATGVVLGGGGARCFAQIGVLRALRDAGIEIDMIGGTSMGAYLAAQHALGWDVERMLEFNRHTWVKERPLNEYNIPYVSLVAGNRFLRITRATYGDACIEDLGIPYFCCSSNITTARVMVHDRGTAWRWLGASIAVPGISPPLFEKGEVLVDGAVLDNLPIDVMRNRCDGVVIAVDVSPDEDLQTDPAFTLCPSSWQILANRMNPFTDRMQIPSIFEVLLRCATLGSVQQVDLMKEQADLYMHPPTESFSMFDWHRIDEMEEMGYRYAQTTLAAWRSAHCV